MQKRNKKSQKPKPAVRLGEPVFAYTSVCHGARATKTPLLKVGLEEAKDTTGMGKFRCTECNKPCKCTRSKNTPSPKTEEVIVAN